MVKNSFVAEVTFIEEARTKNTLIFPGATTRDNRSTALAQGVRVSNCS